MKYFSLIDMRISLWALNESQEGGTSVKWHSLTLSNNSAVQVSELIRDRLSLLIADQ